MVELPMRLGAQEIGEAGVDQHGDDGDRHDDAEQLDLPADAQRPPAHRQVHADMAAQALGVGDAEEGEQRDGLLHPVDIAVDREVEDGAADDLRHADEHQEEDRRGRDQVQAVLQPRPITVRGRQRGRAVSLHGFLPSRSFSAPVYGRLAAKLDLSAARISRRLRCSRALGHGFQHRRLARRRSAP